MSLRRKSCESCYKGRRKCDSTFPVCKRCDRTGKSCRYPQDLNASRGHVPILSVPTGNDTLISDDAVSAVVLEVHDFDFNQSQTYSDELVSVNTIHDEISTTGQPTSVARNLIGRFGEVQPHTNSAETWEWVSEELQRYPRQFAQNGETIFINKDMHKYQIPKATRAAIGICAANELLGKADNTTLFRILSAEVIDLLQPSPHSSLPDDVAKVQALLLYQIIGLYNGDLIQRTITEQQGNILKTWCLQLLQRADQETDCLPLSRERWLVVESVRRVVLITFLLHAVHSVLRYGRCLELPMLASLPVSTDTASWYSATTKSIECQTCQPGTITYSEFTESGLKMHSKKLDDFEKLILVACKGVETMETANL